MTDAKATKTGDGGDITGARQPRPTDRTGRRRPQRQVLRLTPDRMAAIAMNSPGSNSSMVIIHSAITPS